MAIFHAIRYKLTGDLVAQVYLGVGVRHMPQPLDKITHLQHLLAFKDRKEAEEFTDTYFRTMVRPDYSGAMPEDFDVVEIEVGFPTAKLGPTPEQDAELEAQRTAYVEAILKKKSYFRPAQGELNKDYAVREHVVTDQGNGGAYCSNCSADLDNEYDHCPKCKLPLVEGKISGYGFGGSDF